MALTLAQLNNVDPNSFFDALRALNQAGFGVTKTNLPIGDLLNRMIAQGNQTSNSTAAAQTATVAGVPATTDTLTVNVNGASWAYQIADATSVTTAATGLKNFLNADSVFSAAYVATNAAGVLTVTAKRKGTGANAFTFSVSKSGAGGTTFTAGGTTLAGATGVDDLLPIV